MKKTLQLIGLILIALNFSFKSKSSLEINKNLLCKQWVTEARDDKSSKVIITFNQNNSYSHEYVSNLNSKKPNISLVGKWSIGKDKKIHIEFKQSNFKDTFEVISIKENELIINTTGEIKKFQKL